MTGSPCFVCGTPHAPAFTKDFAWQDLGRVVYTRCPACGLVVSRTHAALDDAAWTGLNAAFHADRDPAAGRATTARWRVRAEGYATALADALAAGALATGRPWLDYGAGSGDLADLVERRTGRALLRHEPFVPGGTGAAWVDAARLAPGSCDLVLNTAMFEHVRGREPLDHLAGLVAPDGALALHTVVVPEVPDDPDWFYLLPVHCAFFTNDAMARLCADWGFRSSAHHVPGKLWLLFRRPLAELPDALRREPWLSGEGFVSPWGDGAQAHGGDGSTPRS